MGTSWIDAFRPDLLRVARRTAGLSQRDLAVKLLTMHLAKEGREPDRMPGEKWARAVETERIRVVGYETGAHVPRAASLHQLAVALGVDAYDLLSPDAPRNLATLRARLGLSQDQIAQGLSVGRAYYARVEQGRAPLANPADQRHLATQLQIDLAELERLTSARPTS